jgi:Glycosyl hydrolase family 67 N-terminus.
MDIIKNGYSCSNIVSEQTSIAIFAAKELQKYLFRISGCQLTICTDKDSKKASIFVGSTKWCKDELRCDANFEELKYDGFCIKSIDNGLILTSNAGRGVLFSVYALLEHIGCRWFYPGENGEYIPTLKDIFLDRLDLLENPAFEIRSFAEGSHKAPLEVWGIEMQELIDWCGKMRINSIFNHADPLKDVDEFESIKHQIKKRGMIYEFGGHGVHNLIDRNQFEQKPYLFREVNGERRKDGNFCSSSEEAMNIVISGAEGIMERNPEIDILHLFFEDVFNGSWCECEKCKNIHSSQQQMNVINRIGMGLKEKFPGVMFSMILYHDTLNDIKKITSNPESNVLGYYAPRERCYSHSIGDISCKKNSEYHNCLADTVAKFRDNTYVFEYYDDMILFRKMKINIPEIIVKDLKEYKNAGVNKITSLMFGRYSWWAYEFNMFVYAKAVWEVDYDYQKGLTDFCKRLFPGIEKEMIEYYIMLEQASKGILSFCEYDFVLDLRDIPPQALDFYLNHMEQINKSINVLYECSSMLQGLIEKSKGEQKIKLMREKFIVEVSARDANATYYQMLGRYKYAKGGCEEKENMKIDLEKAISFLNEIKEMMETIPYSVKGNAGGKSLFIEHLCNDMVKFLKRLEEDPDIGF